jgi:hypothetical protein
VAFGARWCFDAQVRSGPGGSTRLVKTGAIWRSGVGVTTVGWAVTIGVIAALLGFDLLLATVRPHAVGYREATAWSAFYIAVAVAFGLVFATLTGWDTVPSTSPGTSWRRACPSTTSSSS